MRSSDSVSTNLIYQTKHNDFSPLPKIRIPTSNNLQLLIYLYAFPEKLGNYIDTLMELDPFQGVQEKALFHGWCESILNGRPLLIPSSLEEEVENYRKRTNVGTVEEGIQQTLNQLQLKHLKKEFSIKQTEYFKTENPALKTELDSLSQEIDKLSSFTEE